MVSTLLLTSGFTLMGNIQSLSKCTGIRQSQNHEDFSVFASKERVSHCLFAVVSLHAMRWQSHWPQRMHHSSKVLLVH